VLGGEGSGLRPRVASACDALVAIPTVGAVGSLNVSAAATVLLFAASGSRSEAE
jgi:23S rRNA (guanosine2251-2'-O)-methyltransferase